jgi:hypothetical protein
MFMPAIRAIRFFPASSALALLVSCVFADHPHDTVAADDFAVSADLFY